MPFSQTHISTVGPRFSDPEVKYFVSYHLIVKKCCNPTKKDNPNNCDGYTVSCSCLSHNVTRFYKA